jgi:hypothetical protein
MVVGNFRDTAHQFDNFAVWDVENMNAFLTGNEAIVEIFTKDFKMGIDEFEARRLEISKTNKEIMEHILDQIGDKHFHLFTYHDDNHWELVQMQEQKIMNFGIDIEHGIEKDHVYILIMDKKKEFNRMSI